jgi:hypothetical protein
MLSAHQNKMVKKKGFFSNKQRKKNRQRRRPRASNATWARLLRRGPVKGCVLREAHATLGQPCSIQFCKDFQSDAARTHSRDRSPRASWMRRLARLVRRLVSNGSVESIHTHHQFEKKIIISSVCHRPLVPTPGSEKIPLLPIWLYTSW